MLDAFETRDIALLALGLVTVSLLGLLVWYVVSRPVLGMTAKAKEDGEPYAIEVRVFNRGRRTAVLHGLVQEWTPNPSAHTTAGSWSSPTGVGAFSDARWVITPSFSHGQKLDTVSVTVHVSYQPLWFWFPKTLTRTVSHGPEQT